MSHFHASKDGANRKAPRVKLDKLANVRKTRERESASSTPAPFYRGVTSHCSPNGKIEEKSE